MIQRRPGGFTGLYYSERGDLGDETRPYHYGGFIRRADDGNIHVRICIGLAPMTQPISMEHVTRDLHHLFIYHDPDAHIEDDLITVTSKWDFSVTFTFEVDEHEFRKKEDFENEYRVALEVLERYLARCARLSRSADTHIPQDGERERAHEVF